MPNIYPHSSRLELPILQELTATSGAEDVRFLYARLTAYFPQLGELGDGKDESRAWRRLVQRAGRALSENRHIERSARGQWKITPSGHRRVAAEESRFAIEANANTARTSHATLGHAEVQQMLLDVGRILGYHVEREHNYYDVVWRTSERSPRLSHVFEVQRRGNLDSALAKLKKAYELQRSKPFLIVAGEADGVRALRSIDPKASGAFHEIGAAIKIMSFEQLGRLHVSLMRVEETLSVLLER